jgi:hypothetical protein
MKHAARFFQRPWRALHDIVFVGLTGKTAKRAVFQPLGRESLESKTAISSRVNGGGIRKAAGNVKLKKRRFINSWKTASLLRDCLMRSGRRRLELKFYLWEIAGCIIEGR